MRLLCVHFACLGDCRVASPNAQQATNSPVIRWGPTTVEWGFFDGSQKPIVTIKSGDTSRRSRNLVGSLGSLGLCSNEMQDLGVGGCLKMCGSALPCSTWSGVKDRFGGANILSVQFFRGAEARENVLEGVKIWRSAFDILCVQCVSLQPWCSVFMIFPTCARAPFTLTKSQRRPAGPGNRNTAAPLSLERSVLLPVPA